MLLPLGYALAKLAIDVMPRPACVWAGRRIADVVCLLDVEGRRAVRANLTQVLRHTGRETESARGRRILRRLVRETFENFAVHIIDFIRLGRIQTDIRTGLLRFDHFDRFERAFKSGRGMISVTAHLGNWEMGAAAAASEGYPINAVVLGASDRRVNSFFASLRETGGVRPIPLGHAARRCFQALKKGEVVAFVADRDVERNGYPVMFFGREATIPRGPAEIAARSGVPVVVGFCVQDERGYFRLSMEEPIIVSGNAPHEERVRTINQAIVALLEKYISLYPSQWFSFCGIWK